MLHKICRRNQKTILFLILILALFIYNQQDTQSVQEDLSRAVLRFQILAASDNEADQAEKLMLRDAILASISPLLSNCQNKEEVIKILAKRLPQINDLANQILVEAGSTHQAKVTLGEAYFPTKVYADLTFPCGNYDALKIEIGQACGHNWWCVMFPRLCFADLCFGYVPENEKDKLKDLITPEHFEQIKNANTTSPAVSAPLMIRFRIFDLISSLFH